MRGPMRFLLFAYDEYYPNGGWKDFRGMYDVRCAAEADGREAVRGKGRKQSELWSFWHVVDIESRSIAASGCVKCYGGPENECENCKART